MEMKWEIERTPGAFASDPCYYKVKLNGNFIIAFSKLKYAKKFIEKGDKNDQQQQSENVQD